MLYYLGKGTELKKDDCKEYKTIEGALKAAAKDETLAVWDETGKVIEPMTDNEPEGGQNPDGAAVSGNTQQGDGNAPQNDGDGAGQTNTPPAQENGQNGANTKPEGGQNPDGAAVSGNTQQGDGNAPQNDGDGAGQTNTPPAQENGQNGANTKPEGGQNPDGAAVSGNTQQGDGNAPQDEEQEQEEPEVIVPQGKMKVTVVCDGALNLRRSAEWGNENICGRAVRGQSYYVKAIHTVAGKKMVQTVDDIFLSGQSEHVQFEQL